jgi:hypothetical protein
VKHVTITDSQDLIADAASTNEKGNGDVLTDLVATKFDLLLLATAFVEEILSCDFVLTGNYGYGLVRQRNYSSFRLHRVRQFLPDLETEVLEKLRVGHKAS